MRAKFGPLKVPVYMQDVIEACAWGFGLTCARETYKLYTKRIWLRNRIKPALDFVVEAERLRFAKNWKGASEEFWANHVIFVDCKDFEIRTTARAKLLGRARHFTHSYRTPGEGRKRECLGLSKWSQKAGCAGVKIYAAVARGEVLLFEEYTEWNQEVAASYTRRVAELWKEKWPDEDLVYIIRDNDKSLGSDRNKRQEEECGLIHPKTPARSPEYNLLDYNTWDHILRLMQAWEASHRDVYETPAQYRARLKQTAYSLPYADVVRALGHMRMQCISIFEARGGVIEDCSGKMNEAKRAKKRKLSPAELHANHRSWLQHPQNTWLLKVLKAHGRPTKVSSLPPPPPEKPPPEKPPQPPQKPQPPQEPQQLPQKPPQKPQPQKPQQPPQKQPPHQPEPKPKPKPAPKPPKQPPKQPKQPAKPPEQPKPQPKRRKVPSKLDQRWADRWKEEELGPPPSFVDQGMHAADGVANACMFLSTCAALSRLPQGDWPVGDALWDAIRGDLEVVRAQALGALTGARRSGRDGLGRAAATLRGIVSDWMLTPAGVAELGGFWERQGFWIHRNKQSKKYRGPRIQDPETGYWHVDRGTWEEEVERVRTGAFAGNHHLNAMAHLLSVRITVLPPFEDIPLITHGSAVSSVGKIVIAYNGASHYHSVL